MTNLVLMLNLKKLGSNIVLVFEKVKRAKN